MKGVLTLINITNKSECCGCTACVSVCPTKCISMKEDNEGFLYPMIDSSSCIQCGLCEKVCPILNAKEEIPFKQDGYVVQNKDLNILKESTAGGAFTAIAKYVLNHNGVVFGVELSEEFIANHIYVESEKELFRFRNSKYIQSCVGEKTFNQVKNFLLSQKLVCFSGTPCQIEGLKSYLGKSYDNLITVDVVCRAVPSPLIFKKYLEVQENKLHDKILSVRFRDKYYGYKYSTMNVITNNNNGNYHHGVESDLWLRTFFSNICDRPSCHECRFKKQYRISDITIWDCFNVYKFSKELDNDKGATRVLVHSNNGRKIFTEILKDFNYIQVEPNKIVEGSNEIKTSILPNKNRANFFIDANHLTSEQLFSKYFPETFKVKAEHFIRIFCYKLGIYSFIKKVFVKITHKY